MLKKFFITWLLTSFLVISVLSQTATLRFNPPIGSNWKYQLVSESKVTQSVMGVEQVVNSVAEAISIVSINSAGEDGTIESVVSIETLKVKIKSEMLDSSFVLPTNFKVRQVFDKYGKIVKVEILQRGESTIPFGGRIDEGYLKMFSWVEFPEKAVKPGETWNFSKTDTMKSLEGETITKVSGNYTFEGIEERLGFRCARLGASSKMDISGKGKIQGMDYGLEGIGSSVGKVWIDLNSGIVVYSEGESEMEMAMGITGQMQMTLPMNQHTKTTLKLIK